VSAETLGPVGAPAGSTAPAAVLWDMDGTLVDTEPYWIECERELVGRYGHEWRDEDAHALVGNSLPVSAAILRERGHVPLEPEVIVEELLDGVIERVRRHVPFRPGARALLSELAAAGVPCALVTMSYRRFTAAVVEVLPAGAFAAVVAGDEVTHGKPHPEPYLTAASRLGVAPAECVAIEDSPAGVASAVAAGVPTLAVEHLVPIAPGPGRTIVRTLDGWTPGELGRLVSR
jgi:HAD superfamily hydrolase (TIGR01509 family)